jgi:hypothetical protein
MERGQLEDQEKDGIKVLRQEIRCGLSENKGDNVYLILD